MKNDVPIGIRHDMPAEEYHAVAAASNSLLSAMAQSPYHCWAKFINPDRPDQEQTAALSAGTLAHCAVLEPEAMAARYVAKPEGHDGRTKEGKAWAAANAGRLIISGDDARTAEAQRDAVMAVPELQALMASGRSEVSAFWFDDETGMHCKLRADRVHDLADGRVILMDLKTCADPSPAGFARSVATYGYHRQAAWYSSGYRAASGREVAAFVFAAVSSAYPFIAVPYMLDDEATARGEQQCRELLATYAQCLRTNEWPAYGPGVQLLSLPAWAK